MERIINEIKNKTKREMLLRILDAVGIDYEDTLNPSPSGDKWFLEQENIESLTRGIDDIKNRKVTRIKDPQNIWESIL